MRLLTLSLVSVLPVALAVGVVACGGDDSESQFGFGGPGTSGGGPGAGGTGAASGGGVPGVGGDYQGPTEPPTFPGEVDDPSVVVDGTNNGGVTIGGQVVPPTPLPAGSAPEVEGVTDWFNGARSAYTIIHDDVCDFQMKGVEENWRVVADRGLVAGWGIIISRCDRTATGPIYTSGTMWTHVADLEGGGQEIVNHSWNHPNIFGIAECADKCLDEASCQASCPLEFRQPSVDGDLEVTRDAQCNYQWGNMRGTPEQVRTGAEGALQLELIDSGARTQQQTGTKPMFFAFPLDLANDTMLQRLKDDGLLGARGGIRDIVGTVNTPDVNINDPLADFRITFDAYNEDAPGASRHEDGSVPGDMLKNYLDEVIKKGGWGLRELHSIRPVAGQGGHGWGPVTLSLYEAHLDEVAALVQQRVLWNASNVDVLKYRRIRAHCGAPTLTGGALSFANAADPMCQTYGAGQRATVSIRGPEGMTISGAEVTAVAPGRVLVHVDPTVTTNLTIN